MRVFIGADPRQQVGPQVLAHSIFWNSSKPVQISYLILAQLPIKRMGLTQFTFSRYLVPYLCNYEGVALFLDADMVVNADISELFALKDETAVQVMQEQARFEWPSMMLFDCAQCKDLTPEYIDDPQTSPQGLRWAPTIGKLPPEWNHCVGYAKPMENPKLIHYTKGIPIWDETRDCEHADKWWKHHELANSSVTYANLMGNSVHAK